ncbi:MAG: ATP-dependent protease, Lon family, partial [Negativicoccus succinicivorans]|nr:ATP-dependent protease, Lon family [Negativicoccus succinicivorans]
MKDIWRRLWSRNSQTGAESEAEFGRQIAVLSGVYSGLIGTERFLLAGSHYNALSYLHAEDPKKRLAGLARIVLEDPDIPVPGEEQSQALLERTENRISDLLARQAVEERLEQKINDALEEKHQEYVNDLRLELLNEETGDFETPQSREKLAQLDKL